MFNDEPTTNGGIGLAGGTGDRAHRRGNLRTIRRAIKLGWIIPEEADESLPNEMYLIATTRTETIFDTEGNPHEVSNARSQIAATKVILEMNGQNEETKPTGQMMVVVNNVNRLPNGSGSDGPTPGAAADHQPLQAVQRFDVRQALGQDDAG